MKRSVQGTVLVEAHKEPVTALGAYMEATGLSQLDLAEAVKIHRNTIGAVAAGAGCHRATARKLALYTGIPEDLIYGSTRRSEWLLYVEGHRVTVDATTTHQAA
jgi:hypothetical protein